MNRGARHRGGQPQEPCRNCGDPTVGEYCPSCGQRKVEVQVSLGALFHDLLQDQFGLEGRTPTTLFALFFRPGHLTREYLDGRVVRYLRPFKLYLVSSLILFLLVGLLSFRDWDDLTWDDLVQEDVPATTEPGEMAEPIPEAEIPEVEIPGPPAVDEPGADPPWHADVQINLGHERLNSLMEARIRRLGEMEPLDAIREVAQAFLSYVPTLMFLLLPVFAGILKLLYLRQGRYYVEHFVFGLHTHAFVFGVFTLSMLAQWMKIESLAPLLFLWAAIYTYLALRRVYGQGHLMTAVKYCGLMGLYFLVLVAAVPPMLIVTLLLTG